MSGRVSAGRVRQVSALLSERDRQVLADVARVRLLQATQVQRLRFHDGTDLSRSRRARRCLQRLHSHGLLVRLQRRVGGVHAGSAGYIYALDALGQAVLDSTGPAGGTRRRRPWEPSATFTDHTLQVAEIYVALHEVAQGNEHLELVEFQAEPGCWRPFTATPGGRQVLKPDAHVRVADGVFEQVSFVEVDRDTEHTPALRRKLTVYVDAFAAGVEQSGGVAFPNVVWIVPGERRATQLRRLVARLPPEHQSLFEITTPQHQLESLRGGSS